MSIDELIHKWQQTAAYHRKCYKSTSERDAELINAAKAEQADEIVTDLRNTKRGAS